MNFSELLIVAGFLTLVLNAIIGIFIANAAQRKGRSWSAFFWLSILAGWLIMAIVVAAIAPVSPTATTTKVEVSPKEPNAAALPVGISLMVFGLLWILTYYLSEAQFPLGAATRPLDIQNWNLFIGLFLVVIGYVLSRVGTTDKNRK